MWGHYGVHANDMHLCYPAKSIGETRGRALPQKPTTRLVQLTSLRPAGSAKTLDPFPNASLAFRLGEREKRARLSVYMGFSFVPAYTPCVFGLETLTD